MATDLTRTRHHAGQYFCMICNELLKLETAKTDGDGHAVHDDCYLKQICSLIPPKVKKPTATQS